MELKLNVYKGKTVEKTYTAEDYALRTGTCEDILGLVDVDKIDLKNIEDDAAAMVEVVKVVIKAFNSFKPMMMDIFDGLTEDEYRRTNIKDVARVVLNVVKYTFGELFAIASSKN